MSSVFVFQGTRNFIKNRIYNVPNNLKIYYFIGNISIKGNLSFLKEYGWEPVDIPLDQNWSQEQIIEEYMDLIASFSQWNAGTLDWWATHFSSKNRINSPLLPNFQELHQILLAIGNLNGNDSLVLINISWPVFKTIQALTSKSGYQLKIYSPPFYRLKDLCKGKYLFWKNFFAEVVYSYLSIWKANKAFGKPKVLDSKIPVYLIKSFTYLKNFNDNIYIDPFFGRLPEYLKEQLPEAQVLTVALGFKDRVQCYKQMKELNSSLVLPLEIYLTYWDILKCSLKWFWKINFDPFRIKGKLYSLGHEITPFFDELINFGGFRISIFHALHFDIAKRLGEMYQIKACFMTYEGRPWERFFMAGLRKENMNTIIVGYQHTVIPLSATDMFLHTKEQELIPIPDKIVTTGIITKKILEQFGSFPKEKIVTGCALRFEYLQNLSLLKRRKDSKQKFVLLVAFGGSEEEIPLLNYALSQATLIKDTVFRMRTHPILSWNQLLSLSSWDQLLPKNVQNSTYLEVLEDLKNCDAILFWGTTVSLEALMLGKPIIHFDRGDLLNSDPLFEFSDFKWEVKRKDSLKIIIQEIKALPESKYCEYQQNGRKYMEKYFYPVTDENMSNFL
jgi:hypothetical protein